MCDTAPTPKPRPPAPPEDQHNSCFSPREDKDQQTGHLLKAFTWDHHTLAQLLLESYSFAFSFLWVIRARRP